MSFACFLAAARMSRVWPRVGALTARAWGLALVVVLLVGLSGCVASRRVVRLDTGEGEPLVHVPRGGQEPVRLGPAEVQEALKQAARDVRPGERPVRHAREVMFDSWQRELYLDWTGRKLVPEQPRTPGPRLLVEPDAASPPPIPPTPPGFAGAWSCSSPLVTREGEMATRRKRARPGDLLEVSTPRGFAYIHYSARDPEYGDVIRVLPGFFATRPLVFVELVSNPKAYFTFYPVGAAVAQGLIQIVAHHPLPPGQELPSVYRRAGARSREGRVLAWLICEGTRETLVRELTEEQRQLPIASIWNHEALLYYLTEEWRPEQDIGREQPKAEDSTPEGPPPPRHVRHYLYFATARVGQAVAAHLVTQGYEVTSRGSADGRNWLVLAEHPMRDVGQELDSVREALERLAREHSGQYDGYEIKVTPTAE